MNGYVFWGSAFILAALAIVGISWLWRESEPPDPTDVWGDDWEAHVVGALDLLDEMPLYDRIAHDQAPALIAEAERILRGAR